MPVVIKPHASHGLEGQQAAQQCPDKRHQVVKYRDRTRDDICNHGDGTCAAKPARPVDRTVVCEMSRASKDPKKHVFRGELESVSKWTRARDDKEHIRERPDW